MMIERQANSAGRWCTLAVGLCLLGVNAPIRAQAQPQIQAQRQAQLRCELSYAGATQTVHATPVADPYDVASVDIGGRFRFKPVMVGAGHHIAYIKLYTYLDTRHQPVLVQVVRYLPPFATPATDKSEVNLTGLQFLYAGPVERELQYQCFLQGAVSAVVQGGQR
ncbi:MAG: hypothetical protein RLZZ612_1371 [Pseudomonadota bacterium]|jgi:hypothetical protein